MNTKYSITDYKKYKDAGGSQSFTDWYINVKADKKPDYGMPAYPFITVNSEGQITDRENMGMTLFDHFAGVVLPEIMNKEGFDIHGINNCTFDKRLQMANEAYKQAAAMLEARKQYIA